MAAISLSARVSDVGTSLGSSVSASCGGRSDFSGTSCEVLFKRRCSFECREEEDQGDVWSSRLGVVIAEAATGELKQVMGWPKFQRARLALNSVSGRDGFRKLKKRRDGKTPKVETNIPDELQF